MRRAVAGQQGRRRAGLAVTTALVACLAAGTVAVPGAAGAATVAPDAGGARGADLRAGVDALVAAGVPGAILVTRDGRRTRRIARGVADVARERPIRASDRFRIASLTKTYTATVVLQLVGERRLALGDSVERWLPGLVPGGDAITIRQLLNHTSGLFDHENDERVLAPYLAGQFDHEWAPRRLVELAVEHPPLFAPGARRSYSNTNYVLAQLIVEQVTGRPLGAELERRIFRPLGLRATEYPTTPQIAGRHVHGYMVVGQPPAIDVTGISPSISPGSGAIVSSAQDVLVFYRALLGGRLLRPGLLRAMKTTLSQGDAADIPGQRYGLGLGSFPTPCGVAWGHNGSAPGYVVFAFTSANGRRQSVMVVNLDARSWPEQVGPRFYGLIQSAYCGAR